MAKPAAKTRTTLADGKGLYLKVKPTGYKVWIFNYLKPFTKNRVADTLGEYPAISLSQARVIRQKNLELLAQNIDPISNKAEHARTEIEARGNTLEHVARNWFEIKKSKITKAYGEDIRRSLELHVFPKIGNIPVHQVRARSTIETLTPIA
ncbi:MAG: integrase arm-type DNA-binding domain-containing protein, partial [Kordiimonadaceae bacterium]|nr:integrase arm-type DNA-binding domain-containing protein [Kordiimonadaceae bacterium]